MIPVREPQAVPEVPLPGRGVQAVSVRDQYARNVAWRVAVLLLIAASLLSAEGVSVAQEPQPTATGSTGATIGADSHAQTVNGLLVGGATGVAVGVVIGLHQCDGAHCTGYAVEALKFGAIGAGIGAAIGVALDHANHRPPSPAKRTSVVVVGDRHVRAAAIAVRIQY
jgi:hypothetical protein